MCVYIYTETHATSAYEERPLYLFDKIFGETNSELLSDYDIPEFFRDDFFELLSDFGSAFMQAKTLREGERYTYTLIYLSIYLPTYTYLPIPTYLPTYIYVCVCMWQSCRICMMFAVCCGYIQRVLMIGQYTSNT